MLREILAGALGKAKSEHELGLLTIDGLTAIASNVTGNKAFSLFRIEKEGLQLLKIAGANGTTSGAYSVKLFIAGDANRDTKVDGTDSSLIEAALGTTAGAIGYTPLADFDQDGRIDTADLHLYRQNLGFIPNQAPVVHPVTPVQTHIDLEVLKSVVPFISDQENDPIVYRIVGTTNGTARIASDGSSVSFTPTTGFFGTAGFSIVADDGYATSQVAAVTVNASNAQLVKLDFVTRAPRLSPRASQLLQLVGDFTDEQNVALPASYLQFQVLDSALSTQHSFRQPVSSPVWRMGPASSPPRPRMAQPGPRCRRHRLMS